MKDEYAMLAALELHENIESIVNNVNASMHLLQRAHFGFLKPHLELPKPLLILVGPSPGPHCPM